MSIDKAVTLGLAGNEMSKAITGTNKVSAGRTTVATGAGATLGAVASEVIVVGAGAAGFSAFAAAAAPVLVPLTVASGIVAGIASLFEY